MRAALTAVALLVLASAGARAGADEIVDIGALLAPNESHVAPRLGTASLRSGGLHYTYDLDAEEADGRPVPFAIGEIAVLLGDAETLRPRALLVEPHEAENLRSLSRDLLRTVRVGIVVTHPDGRVETGEIRMRPGWWGRSVSVRRHSLVWDFDPELACDNSGGLFPCVLGDPRVDAALDGLAVQARPFLLDGGRRVVLEVLLQTGELTRVETHRTGARYLGAIEQPTYRGAVVAVSGTVAAGEPLVARLRSARGETVVRLVPEVEGSAGSGRLRALDVGLAQVKPLDVVLPAENSRSEDKTWERAGAVHKPAYVASSFDCWEDVLAGLDEGGAFSAETARAGPVAAMGPIEFQEQAVARLSRRLAPLARTVRLDLALRAGGDMAATASLTALHGRTAFVRVGADRSVVRDHDVEVGCFVQIADPEVQPVFSGTIVRAVPHVAPDGRSVLLDLTVRVQRMVGDPETRELGEPVCSSVQVVRLIERELSAELVVGEGETARLSLGRSTDGRVLVLEVRAVAE